MQDNSKSVVMSFKYSLSKDHSISFITKAKSKCNDVIDSLFTKLSEISKLTMLDFQDKPKKSGYEGLPISSFSINFSNIKNQLGLSNDSKILVFRFHKEKCRLLTVYKNEILYIIGYDWNFSAYKH